MNFSCGVVQTRGVIGDGDGLPALDGVVELKSETIRSAVSGVDVEVSWSKDGVIDFDDESVFGGLRVVDVFVKGDGDGGAITTEGPDVFAIDGYKTNVTNKLD